MPQIDGIVQFLCLALAVAIEKTFSTITASRTPIGAGILAPNRKERGIPTHESGNPGWHERVALSPWPAEAGRTRSEVVGVLWPSPHGGGIEAYIVVAKRVPSFAKPAGGSKRQRRTARDPQPEMKPFSPQGLAQIVRFTSAGLCALVLSLSVTPSPRARWDLETPVATYGSVETMKETLK